MKADRILTGKGARVLADKGATVVMATHEPDYWRGFASYQVHLRGGRLASFEALSEETV